MHYRSKWYVTHGRAPILSGMGIHGQNLFIDATNQIVIAKLSSQAPPLDVDLIAATDSAVTAVRMALS
jgi:hypothetical protein